MGFTFSIADPVTDKQAIISLWKVNLDPCDWEQRYQWLYENNPVGAMRTVLATHDESGEIVGAASIYPQRISLFGKSELVGIAADYMVDKRYRLFGPAIQLQRRLCELAQDFGFIFLFAYPGQAAKGVMKRVGYEPIGAATRYVKLLRTNRIIAKKIKNNLLSTIVASSLNSILRLESYIKAIPYRFNNEIVSGSNLDNLSEEFVVGEVFADLVAFGKNKDEIAWKHFNDINQSEVFTIRNQDNHYSSIIYSIENTTVTIADILVTADSFLQPLLRLFAYEMHKQKMDTISVQFMGQKSFIDKLVQLRFYQRTGDRSCYLNFGDISIVGREKLLEENSWFIFESDMDI